jgi:hypothetical protein
MVVLGDARPVGRGPERLEPPIVWPSVPVLLQGSAGTGRKTWADWLMRQHGGLEPFIARSEKCYGSTEDIYGWLVDDFLAVGSTNVRWASLKLDEVDRDAQNMLLSLAENLPENCRMILRATGTSILPALRSRCFVVNVQPPTFEQTVNLLQEHNVTRAEAEELAELRPGRPGLALALAEELPLRGHLGGVLNAADARDYTALASSLMEIPEGVRMWFQEWVRASMANKPFSHPKLAREAGIVRLAQCDQYLEEVRNPRLAVRAAATVLATRP